MSLYFGENLPNLAVYCTFLFKEIGLCTILSENHNEVEQIMDIRVLLNANNRTKTDVSDDSLYF